MKLIKKDMPNEIGWFSPRSMDIEEVRDDRMDSRGAGGPDSEIFRNADH
jgi:hypothetical protein